MGLKTKKHLGFFKSATPLGAPKITSPLGVPVERLAEIRTHET